MVLGAWGDGLLSVGHNREADNANALIGLGTYMTQMLAQRRADPAGDLLSVIAASIYDGGQPRYVAQDTELGGQPLKEGDIVVPAHDAADRDEREFGPHPERFHLAWRRSRHFGFGWGAHHCLGADLARLELRLMLKAFTMRLSALRLAVPADQVTLAHGTTIRRLQNLKVTWGAAN
jgi:cytochrome P450